MATLMLQMLPIGVVVAWILILRRPPVQAAFAGVALVFLLWILGAAAPLSTATTAAIVKDTGILFLSTACVIVPGLAFVMLVERGGAPQAIGAWVKELGWTPAAQIIFIVLGLAPLLESMTGFGVSLIATVPLLIGLFTRQSGMKIALAGMVIMPWGTLGLATLVGALLAHLPAGTLGSHSALISAPVFFCLAAIALWQAGIRTVAPWFGLVVMTALFVTVLYCINQWIGPEVSGVLAGLAVACVGLAVSLSHRKRLVRWPDAAWPYLALLGIIVVSRGVFVLTGWDAFWIVKGEHTSWKPLASPGLALLMSTILISIRQGATAGFPWQALFRRAKFPVTTIFLFLLLSQVMVNAGFLVEAQRILQSLSGVSLVPTIALLAGIAGYVTGSNVGGNTLVMPSIAALATGHGPWLAAMVNSAAGHGALGSLSILSLITGLAAANRQEENHLIRFAFGLVLLNIVIVAVAGVCVLYIGCVPGNGK
ncbi:L-lactate permease [Verminephrobacter eiseniae]|uniref:L-lactate permease n=1 Tax=Verminephrobacter eiseniae TaxID=364317 RepID=UPI002237CBA3|nr:L-lactate permease [Verminephrobacter eiseniae]MCW5235329.1 transporter [Verminephrobacter eiseniae]